VKKQIETYFFQMSLNLSLSPKLLDVPGWDLYARNNLIRS